MSALNKGVEDVSVEAAARFARECLAFQLYRPMAIGLAGHQRMGLIAVSGLHLLIATGPAFQGPKPGEGSK